MVDPLNHCIYFAQQNYIFIDKMHSLSTFSEVHSLPRPSFFAQPSTFARSPQLRGSRTLEMQRFRRKERDLCLPLLSLSCHRECNRWQIITQAGSQGLAKMQNLDQRTFQVRWHIGLANNSDRRTGGPFQVALTGRPFQVADGLT